MADPRRRRLIRIRVNSERSRFGRKKEKQGYDHAVISIMPLFDKGHPMQAPLQARDDSDAVQTKTARTATQERRLVDNRPMAVAQCKLAEMMNNSPRALQLRALSNAVHNAPQMVAQRHEMNALSGWAVKPQGDGAVPAGSLPAQREEKPNNTGLPNQLKSGIESLSGMSMDHVKVHYNSDKPAQLQAHAYAQGGDIHLAPGQEKHLPHEAWHVVQQAQGRVRPTMQMARTVPVNNDQSLEREADVMGGLAGVVQRKIARPTTWFAADKPAPLAYSAVSGLNNVILDLLTKTSKPEEIGDMGDSEIHKTILDPSRNNKQRLTKMHLIRGRFGAPGEVENLKLGTALSNNFDDASHYAQVEKPIADFLNEDKGKRMVDYKVTPYGDPPAYFDARLQQHPSARDFVKQMCPQIFACAVQFAGTEDNVNWYWSKQQIEHVPLDNKYTNGGNVVP